MISLLCPTRNRPGGLKRLYLSAMETATHPENVEVVAVVDSDDDSYGYVVRERLSFVTVRRGEHVMSELWNVAWRHATGPIFAMSADDEVFRTPGWDTAVEAAFPPDGIGFVFGDDGYAWPYPFGTLGFLRAEWCDALGRFCPSGVYEGTAYFSSDYTDTWLNDVAKALDRHIRVPILTEHMHVTFRKMRPDKTYRENRQRFRRERPDLLYPKLAGERGAEVAKLQAVMA